MGFYRDRVFPRLVDRACNTAETRRIRSEICAGLTGQTVEIGFGTGLNLPHLPPAVSRLLAVDPMRAGRDLAAARIASSDIPVDFVGLDGQTLSLDDDSVDCALSTWTLCTIPDPVAAVREIRRVLRPGGSFFFVEHGSAPDRNVRRWQNRLNGVQRRVGCGCNMNRDVPGILTAGGMTIESLDTFYAEGNPKMLGWTFQGTCTPSENHKLPGR